MVKLISYTTNEMNDTLTSIVAHAARVSNPTNQHNTETAPRLLSYLKKHAHWSPFEMVNICMEINTTRDIARQILRHRSFSFQEFSQRYASANDLQQSLTFREARLQDTTNRQNSLSTTDEELIGKWNGLQEIVHNISQNAYTTALSMGIAKEQARALLPEGLTNSRLYMNGTLRSWIHYCDIRTSVETQKEHRDIAIQCQNIIEELLQNEGK